MVGFDFSYTFSNTFYNLSSFVTKDTWEETFWIFAAPSISNSVAEGSPQYLNSDLSSLQRSYPNILDRQWLLGSPSHRRFAGNDLTWSPSGNYSQLFFSHLGFSLLFVFGCGKGEPWWFFPSPVFPHSKQRSPDFKASFLFYFLFLSPNNSIFPSSIPPNKCYLPFFTIHLMDPT